MKKFIKISNPFEDAKIVKSGRQAYIKTEDLQLFGHMYGRAYSFRGTGYGEYIGRYYIVSRRPSCK